MKTRKMRGKILICATAYYLEYCCVLQTAGSKATVLLRKAGSTKLDQYLRRQYKLLPQIKKVLTFSCQKILNLSNGK